jgi:hypothetical protein
MKGAGKAHKCCRPHTEVFQHAMIGTFNIAIPYLRITSHLPGIRHNGKNYWFVILKHKDAKSEFTGWAVRDDNSKQRVNRLEVLTKEPLPDFMKDGDIDVALPKVWCAETAKKWAKSVPYWFQGFTFAPRQRADSKHIWTTINRIDWSGQRVLDLGCHYGYFSFKASCLGSRVVGVDKNTGALGLARTIRDHIFQQDVHFAHKYTVEEKSFDVIMYLSVHHQLDENYSRLEQRMSYLKTRSRKHLFVELIMPPMFPKDRSLTESDIDEIVGGTVLDRYKHKVRGMRKIYHVTLNDS